MDPMNRTESQFYPWVFALAAAGLLAYALFRVLQPFVGAILWGFLLAFLLFPVNERLRRALGGRQGAAAIALILAVILLLVGPATLLAVAFADQASELLGHMQKAAAQNHRPAERPSSGTGSRSDHPVDRDVGAIHGGTDSGRDV